MSVQLKTASSLSDAKQRFRTSNIDSNKLSICEMLVDATLDLITIYIKSNNVEAIQYTIDRIPIAITLIDKPSHKLKMIALASDPDVIDYIGDITNDDIWKIITSTEICESCLNNMHPNEFKSITRETALMIFESDVVDNECLSQCADLDWYKKIAPVYKLKEL